jgi:hypothetical protein
MLARYQIGTVRRGWQFLALESDVCEDDVYLVMLGLSSCVCLPRNSDRERRDGRECQLQPRVHSV